jgi:hypothetical protein
VPTVIDELVALLGYDVKGEADLKRFNQGLDQLEKKAAAVGARIGQFAAIAGAAVVGGFSFLGKGVIDTSAKFESFGATLETIEGSSEKAKAALGWVSDFAKTTPYEVEEVTAAFVKLKSYGLDPMDGTMKVIGNTASAMGKTLNQAVEAWADATTGEFERLKEFGLRAKKAKGEVTFTWTEAGKEMKKTVKESGEDIQKFLRETFDKKFSGAMERQSRTWKGMTSNLADSWTDFQRKIGDAGFFDVVKKKLDQLMKAIEGWNNDGTVKRISTTLSNGFTSIANAVEVAYDRITTHTKFLSDNYEKFRPYVLAIGAAFAALFIAAFPLTAVFTGIVIAIDDLLTHLQGGESVIGDFITWLKAIIPASEETKQAILALAGVITTALVAAMIAAPRAAGKFLIAGGIAAIAGLGHVIYAALAGLAPLIVQGFIAAFALLSNPVGWAIILAAVVAGLVAYFWDDLVKLWEKLDFKELGQKMGNKILDGLKSITNAIKDWFADLIPDWAKDWFSNGPSAPRRGAGGAASNDDAPREPRGFNTTPGGAATGRIRAPAKIGPQDDPRGLADYIRKAAERNNIDPDVALRVAKSEGLSTFAGDQHLPGGSWGAFQLYKGGGEGNRFQAETGLDPADPQNEKATIDYALKRAAEIGWGPWHGAKRVGISRWEGVGVKPQTPAPAAGAPEATPQVSPPAKPTPTPFFRPPPTTSAPARTPVPEAAPSTTPVINNNIEGLDKLRDGLRNYYRNMEKVTHTPSAATTISHDRRVSNTTSQSNVTVGDVHVKVDKADQAPEVVGKNIAAAVGKGANAQPSRMQRGPAE